MGGTLEKPQLINFIAKVMEDSGFRVYKNFKTSKKVIDIYAVLPTTIGDFGVVVACENFDKDYEVGVDILKDMEEAAISLNASKVTVVTSSYFSSQASNYALRKNIKLVDRENLVELAKKYQDNTSQTTLDNSFDGRHENFDIVEEYPEYDYDASDMDYLMQKRDANPIVYKNTLYRQDDSNHSKFSFLNRSKNQDKHYPSLAPKTSLYSYNKNQSRALVSSPILITLLNNTIFLILMVVIVSYLLSFIFSTLLHLDAGISGLIEMFVAIVVSYGLSFITEKDSYFIVKGTFVFFISLIILILLIFI